MGSRWSWSDKRAKRVLFRTRPPLPSHWASRSVCASCVGSAPGHSRLVAEGHIWSATCRPNPGVHATRARFCCGLLDLGLSRFPPAGGFPGHMEPHCYLLLAKWARVYVLYFLPASVCIPVRVARSPGCVCCPSRPEALLSRGPSWLPASPAHHHQGWQLGWRASSQEALQPFLVYLHYNRTRLHLTLQGSPKGNVRMVNLLTVLYFLKG